MQLVPAPGYRWRKTIRVHSIDQQGVESWQDMTLIERVPMKQRITRAQMDELADVEKIKLADWADPIDALDWPWSSDGVIRRGKLPLLTIGQMIWFLDDHHETGSPFWDGGFIYKGKNYKDKSDEWVVSLDVLRDSFDAPELVDALWMAVKAVLKEEVNDGTTEA